MSEKEEQARKITKKYMWISMGAGLIPILGLDLAAVSGTQVKMLADLSKVYGIPFRKSLGKASIASLAGYVLPHAMSYSWMGSMLKQIPVVGILAGAPAMALFSGAYTWALGNVFIQHFASGGTFLDFDAEKVKTYFQTQFEEGRKMAETAEPAEPAKKEEAAAGV